MAKIISRCGILLVALASIAQTKPATIPAPSEQVIIKTLNSMPQELWPVGHNTFSEMELRNGWISQNIYKKPWEFTGKIISVGHVKVVNRGLHVEDHASLRVEMEGVVLWGQERTARVEITLDGVTPADSNEWTNGMVVTVKGQIATLQPDKKPNPARIIIPHGSIVQQPHVAIK